MLSKQVKARIKANKVRRIRCRSKIARSYERLLKTVDNIPLPTGFMKFDGMAGGFKRGELMTIMASGRRAAPRVDPLALYEFVNNRTPVQLRTNIQLEDILALDPGPDKIGFVRLTRTKPREPNKNGVAYTFDPDFNFFKLGDVRHEVTQMNINEAVEMAPMGWRKPDGTLEITAWSLVDKPIMILDSFAEMENSNDKQSNQKPQDPQSQSS